jgi:hypothetical protein
MASPGLKQRPVSRGRLRPSQGNISAPGQASPMPRMGGDNTDSSMSEKIRKRKVSNMVILYSHLFLLVCVTIVIAMCLRKLLCEKKSS